ncbi:MAG: MFS transporter [Pseudomonadota bacterium]
MLRLSATPTEGGDPAAGWPLVVALGITQIIAWGSIYYGFALLLDPLQQALAADRTTIVGAFSAALLVSGVLAPFVGRTIDRVGGRAVMTAGSIAGGVLLALLARVESAGALYAVWIGLGAAMAATLYEPAFAVLTQVFRAGYRRAITLLTLFGGFASTVFWPLATALIERYGWRDALLVLAALNLVVCAPLHAWLLPGRGRPAPATKSTDAAARTLGEVLAERSFYLLAFAFLAHALVVAAMGVHLIAMLVAKGLTPLAAAGVGAIVGPMQVLGRLAEFTVSRRLSAVQVGRVAVLLQPLALIAFLAADGGLSMLALFALLYGTGNGALTIVRGTVPVELYGRAHYGAVTGALATPGLLARAAGPLVAAAIASLPGGYPAALWTLAALGAAGAVAFYMAAASSARRSA